LSCRHPYPLTLESMSCLIVSENKTTKYQVFMFEPIPTTLQNIKCTIAPCNAGKYANLFHHFNCFHELQILVYAYIKCYDTVSLVHLTISKSLDSNMASRLICPAHYALSFFVILNFMKEKCFLAHKRQPDSLITRKKYSTKSCNQRKL